MPVRLETVLPLVLVVLEQMDQGGRQEEPRVHLVQMVQVLILEVVEEGGRGLAVMVEMEDNRAEEEGVQVLLVQ